MPRAKPWRVRMQPRDHTEPHRQASWLELLFDLSFVVAVAQAAIELEHALAAGHVSEGLFAYLFVFAAIWWAWVAFTWFANVFDTDDGPYRLLMFVMIAGSLGLAAGVPQIAHLDLRIGVISYVIMRAAYIGQWWRVLRSCGPEWRRIAQRMIVLTTVIQLVWIGFLWVPASLQVPALVVCLALDLATPYLVGWDARQGGHRHHIVERYGLFTIIVLGESIAAATMALTRAIGEGVAGVPLLTLAIGGLVIVASLWWMYFDFMTGGAPDRDRAAQYVWSYLHYAIFAGIAAIGAGLSLAVTWLADAEHVQLGQTGVALVIASAVVIVMLTMVAIEYFAEAAATLGEVALKLLGAALVFVIALAAPRLYLPVSVLGIGFVLAGLVAIGVRFQNSVVRAGLSASAG